MTLKEALCDRRYYRGMLVLAVIYLSQSFNGCIVGAYGQVMLGKIFGHSTEGDKNVNMILNLMAVIGPISLFFSIFTTSVKSRKLIFMLYAFSIGLMNVGFAVSDLLHMAWLASIFALGMIAINSLLGLPITIVYANEVGSNSMLALCSIWSTLLNFATSFGFPVLVKSLS